MLVNKDRDKYLEESLPRVDQMSVLVQEVQRCLNYKKETLTEWH